MEPRPADFKTYVARALDLMERVPISASDAARRIALDVDLGVRGAVQLRQAVQEATEPPASTRLDD